MVVDEALTWPKIWCLVGAFAGNPLIAPYAVRLLLVDQASLFEPGDLSTDERELVRGARYAENRAAKRIEPLQDDWAKQLVKSRLGYDLPEAVFRQLALQADGRPFYLILSTARGIRTEPSQELSDRARDMIKRADHVLSGDGLKVLAVASLAGPVDVDELQKIVPEVKDLESLRKLFPEASPRYLKSKPPALHPEILAQEVFLTGLARWISTEQKKFCEQTIA
jgi:hypothetical protein